MELNINNFKEITGDIRKVLVYMVNRENPFESVYINFIKEELGKDKHFVDDLIKYMGTNRMLTGKNPDLLVLTPTGLQLGQDIANNDIWDEAVKICDEQKIYSLQTVAYTVNRIIQQRICKAVESK